MLYSPFNWEGTGFTVSNPNAGVNLLPASISFVREPDTSIQLMQSNLTVTMENETPVSMSVKMVQYIYMGSEVTISGTGNMGGYGKMTVINGALKKGWNALIIELSGDYPVSGKPTLIGTITVGDPSGINWSKGNPF